MIRKTIIDLAYSAVRAIMIVAVIKFGLAYFGLSVRLTVEPVNKSLVIVPDNTERLI